MLNKKKRLFAEQFEHQLFPSSEKDLYKFPLKSIKEQFVTIS